MANRWNETVGTLSNGALSIAANGSRKGMIVSNNSDTVMTLRVGGQTATAATGVAIPAGTALALTGNNMVRAAASLFCAGSSKAYTVYEW